jgi:DNA topoisomerase IB
MIRFSSTTVPFAAKTYQLAAGEALTAETLAALVGANAQAKETAVVCPDRATLLAATKAFRAAMGVAPKPAAEAGASPPVVRWGKTEVVPVSEVEALKAQVAELKATLELATGELEHLRSRNAELEATAAPRSRRRGSRVPAA